MLTLFRAHLAITSIFVAVTDSLIGAGLVYCMTIHIKYFPYTNYRLCDGYPEGIQVVSLGSLPVSWVKGPANQSVVVDLEGYTDKCSEPIDHGNPFVFVAG